MDAETARLIQEALDEDKQYEATYGFDVCADCLRGTCGDCMFKEGDDGKKA